MDLATEWKLGAGLGEAEQAIKCRTHRLRPVAYAGADAVCHPPRVRRMRTVRN